MNSQHWNAAASCSVGHQIGRGEPAHLAAVAPCRENVPRYRADVEFRTVTYSPEGGVKG
jgi:hypothetical protein